MYMHGHNKGYGDNIKEPTEIPIALHVHCIYMQHRNNGLSHTIVPTLMMTA